jgi:GR25 family glycosyltransferase involved in LPS biosynthesis
MNWAYTIITVDDSRDFNKAEQRNYLRELPEVFISWADCRKQADYELAIDNNSDILSDRWENILPGEFGVFLSQIQAWKYASTMEYDGLVVLEDDALLNDGSYESMMSTGSLLPDDWDTFSLYVPEGHWEEYYTHRFNDRGMALLNMVEGGALEYKTVHPQLARAYQGYSCVGTVISRAGGRKLLDLIKRDGMYTPVDVALFEWAKAGDINAYSPTPPYADIANINWEWPSVIRGTDIEDQGVWF